MCESSDLITAGSHVIVQRQSYRKVYKVAENARLMLGKDQVDMHAIVGKPYWSTFKMVPVKAGKRTFVLEATPKAESLEDLRGSLPSGSDNRCIMDDGTSQKLSKEEILDLRESGMSSREIVGTLIENSKTFATKTEYSQEKYLRKKERKYFQYLTICKPTVRLLHEIYFRQDYAKIGCLRMDALAQLLSYCNVKSNGSYVLYDSGSHGLPAAGMLNRIGADTTGTLIYLHPGNVPQMTLVQAMNFPTEQISRLITANIYSFIRMYYQGDSQILQELEKKWLSAMSARVTPSSVESRVNADQSEDLPAGDNRDRNSSMTERPGKDNLDVQESRKTEESELPAEPSARDKNDDLFSNAKIGQSVNVLKRKQLESLNCSPAKKPKWLLETKSAVSLLKDSKAQGLAIVAREHPLNIVKGLLPFLGSSRPFVIFHTCREPLQETYVALKQRCDVINLRLFSNFLRSYQVLPDRTHPDVLTSDLGGYLLSGYLVD